MYQWRDLATGKNQDTAMDRTTGSVSGTKKSAISPHLRLMSCLCITRHELDMVGHELILMPMVRNTRKTPGHKQISIGVIHVLCFMAPWTFVSLSSGGLVAGSHRPQPSRASQATPLPQANTRDTSTVFSVVVCLLHYDSECTLKCSQLPLQRHET